MEDTTTSAYNIATYKAWVDDISKKGKTPADMVAFVRIRGFEEYADKVESFISEMQALSEELAQPHQLHTAGTDPNCNRCHKTAEATEAISPHA